MKVLFADDEESMRILVKRILADAGHECVLVEDGAQALAALSEKPDVVVLDAMMPVIDGYEACRRLRERDSRIPVMILTARSDIIDKRIGFRSGADDYVVKPFDPNELLLRLEALYRRGTLSDAPARKGSSIGTSKCCSRTAKCACGESGWNSLARNSTFCSFWQSSPERRSRKNR